jgi:basic membrane protein A
MQRKLFSLMLVVVLLAPVMAGCGGTTPTAKPEPSQAAAVATVAPKTYKVALIVNQRFGDKGPSDDLQKGLDRAALEFGVQTKSIESADPAQHEENIRAMAEEGYDLVIVTFPAMADALEAVAKDYPDTKFLGIWIWTSQQFPNVRTVEYRGYRVCYLLGVLAGMMTNTNKLGRILGGDSPDMNVNYWAFVDGAQSVNPKAEIQIGYTNSFEDPAKGKELALLMYNSGVDIIMTDASRSGLGVVEAAEETGNFVIGDPVFHPELAPANYITALDLGWADSVYVTVKDLVNGQFTAEHIIASFISGSAINISWGPFTSFEANGPKEMVDKIPAAEAKMNEEAAKIESGQLEVIYKEDSGQTVAPIE